MRRYEILVKWGKTPQRPRKALKKEKSKAVRLAQKKIVQHYLKGDDYRAGGVATDPRGGWSL